MTMSMPDLSLHLWRPITGDQFLQELHNLVLSDEQNNPSVCNRIWPLEDNRLVTMFYAPTDVLGDRPALLILHSEDDRGTKLLYFRHVGHPVD